MLKTLSTRLSLGLAALGAGGLLSACGDNLHPGGSIDAPPGIDGHEIPDAEVPDAEVPDANPPTATVSSTLAITDVAITDNVAAYGLSGIKGGSISLTFSDLTTGGGTVDPTYHDAVGSCMLTTYDPTHTPNPPLDSGTISITGTGLLKTVGATAAGACTFQAALGGYACISDNVAGTATIVGTGLGAAGGNVMVAYTFPGVHFGMRAPVNLGAGVCGAAAANTITFTLAGANQYFQAGEFLTIAGTTLTGTGTAFNTTVPGPGAPIAAVNATTVTVAKACTTTDTSTGGTATAPNYKITTSILRVSGFTTTAGYNGAVPVLTQLSDDTVMALNQAAGTAAQEVVAGTGSYTMLNGFSPIPVPTALPSVGVTADFLGDSTKTITIAKAADAVWPLLNETVPSRAQGLQLDTTSAQPQSFDFTNPANAITYSCGGITTPIAIASATRTGNVVTVTTTAAHNFISSYLVTIAGSTPSNFNTTNAAITVTSPTTFTYAQTAADGAATTPGTVGRQNCGTSAADTATGHLQAMVISGRATKKDVTSVPGYTMPTEVPGTDTWMEWQCSAPLGTSITMPAGLVQKIIDFAPTRVETRVIVAAGALLYDDLNGMKLLFGHGLVGHTNHP